MMDYTKEPTPTEWLEESEDDIQKEVWSAIMERCEAADLPRGTAEHIAGNAAVAIFQLLMERAGGEW